MFINERSFTYDSNLKMIKVFKIQKNIMDEREKVSMVEHLITIIELKNVNCYLVKGNNGYVLIDSGLPKNREEVEEKILKAGCDYGNLNLVVLTKVLNQSS